MHAYFVSVDGIDFLSSVCFISLFQAIQVSRNIRFQNYQNLGDRYVLLIAYRFVVCFAYAFTEPNLLFYVFPVHDEKHCRINFANTVGLIFRKEMLIV
jgi:hypothetical protein